jgi:preprotein translocase subunit SecF
MAGFLSGTLIIIGLISLVLNMGPHFGIDFRGGVKIFAKFNRVVNAEELNAKLTELGYNYAKIQIDAARQEASIDIGYSQKFESEKIVVSLAADPGDSTATSIQISSTAEKVQTLQSGNAIQLIEGNHRPRNEIREIVQQDSTITLKLANEIGVDLTQAAVIHVQENVGHILSNVLREGSGDWRAVPDGVSVDKVGPSVGKDLKWRALWSVLFSIGGLLLYIRVRFESFHFATGAIAALIHDILITLGIFSVFAKEINLPTVAAFLTIIGYSLNDTIVVFDRVRENTTLLKGTSYTEIINRSINQSLSRTVITSLTTFFVVLTIFVLTGSGSEINTFALALIVGVIVGTYSSVFVASPILQMLHRRDQRTAA